MCMCHFSEVGDDCIRLERIQDKKFDYNEAFTALSKFYGEKRDIDKNVHSNGRFHVYWKPFRFQTFLVELHRYNFYEK